MKRYSLANHILSIESNDPAIRNMFNVISIGGEGSYTGSINVSQQNNLWETEGFATGGWVHNKNLSRCGTVTVNLSQLAEQVAKFIQLCNTFYSADYEGFTLTITTNEGRKIATCTDCYIQKIPDQNFSETAGRQDWTFTCGHIAFGQ